MSHPRRLLVVVPLLFALFVPPAFAGGGGGSTDAEIKAEKRILKLINEYRVNKGLTALTLNTIIQREARKHSNYMGNHGELSHDNFDERVARIEDDDSGVDGNKVCETTGNAQGYDSPGPVAKKIVIGWKHTASLKACLLDHDFSTDSAGVGVQLFVDSWWVTFIAANDSSP